MKTIWLVGGSGDIGRAIGTKFGERDWDVWLSARTPSRLDAAADELRSAGVSVDTVRLDAAAPDDARPAVERIAADVEDLTVLVYNVSPQSNGDGSQFESYLQHTALGLHRLLTELDRVGLVPDHLIIPTSSKARDPAAVSPEYHASKQVLFALARATTRNHDVTASVLWLGRRTTENGWRWLRPSEMADAAWESYETGVAELLVGDRY